MEEELDICNDEKDELKEEDDDGGGLATSDLLQRLV